MSRIKPSLTKKRPKANRCHVSYHKLTFLFSVMAYETWGDLFSSLKCYSFPDKKIVIAEV